MQNGGVVRSLSRSFLRDATREIFVTSQESSQANETPSPLTPQQQRRAQRSAEITVEASRSFGPRVSNINHPSTIIVACSQREATVAAIFTNINLAGISTSR